MPTHADDGRGDPSRSWRRVAGGWGLVGLVALVGVVAVPEAAGRDRAAALSPGDTSLVRPSSVVARSPSKRGHVFSTRRMEGFESAASPPGEAQRVAGFLGPSATGGSGGQVGVFVRPVGSQTPTFALNPDLRFEPASSIKVLLLLEAVQAVEGGSDSWTDPIAVYAYPNSVNGGGNPTNPNLCPLAADEVAENVRPNLRLGQAAHGMMWASDNTFTRAVLLRYGGLAPAVAKAAQLGMSDTTLQQDLIGCAYQEGKRNFTTLRDLSILYGSVAAGASVGDPGNFFGFMPSGTWDANSRFAAVLAEEVGKVGLDWSSAQRDQFLGAAFVASKGGSYIIACGGTFGNPPGCSNGQYAFDYSVAGIQTIPFRDAAGAIQPRTYSWGNFIFERIGPCNTASCGDPFTMAINNAYFESFRGLIHEALVSWKVAANNPPRAAFTASPTSVYVGDPVSFDASASTDPDSTIAAYTWDLGDGTKAAGKATRHQYAQPGTYSVGLTVSDDVGESARTSRVITATPRVAARSPIPSCLGRRATIIARPSQRTRGTAGPDVIVGTARGDTIEGRGGNDLICSGKGRDRISGAAGNDRVLASRGSDRIHGGKGNDRLSGGAGRDSIAGGPGRDRIKGGPGHDRTSDADSRRDRIDCGLGRDRATIDLIDRPRRCETMVRRRAD